MASNSTWQFSPLGDSAIVLSLPARIDPDINARLHAMADWLRQSNAPITDLVPAYHTLTVFYDACATDFEAMRELLAKAESASANASFATREIELPVCYDLSMAPDLPELAAYCRLSIADVIAIHSIANYRVYFLGFKPGFAYLGGLDARLNMPRKATPRLSVPAGAVGIGGEQTAVYPCMTPGGWQIIGRCPTALFDITRSPPSLMQAGDNVRFRAISLDDFHAMGGIL
jgi:KipI family sensor histidine kinase inhibitor